MAGLLFGKSIDQQNPFESLQIASPNSELPLGHLGQDQNNAINNSIYFIYGLTFRSVKTFIDHPQHFMKMAYNYVDRYSLHNQAIL